MRCVVTGAGSGLGRATAAALKKAGHQVVGVDIANTQVLADLSHEAGRQSASAAVLEACSGRIDALATFAGVSPLAAPESIVSINYFGTVAFFGPCIGALSLGSVGDAAGSVVTVSSNSMAILPPDEDLLAACLDGDEQRARALASGLISPIVYATSKAAVAIKSRELASLWAPRKVRINSIAPGAAQTPMLEEILEDPTWGPATRDYPTPLGRNASPQDVANLTVFLLGPTASYITGQVIYLDGGAEAAARPRRF